MAESAFHCSDDPWTSRGKKKKKKALFTSIKINSCGWLRHIAARDYTAIKAHYKRTTFIHASWGREPQDLMRRLTLRRAVLRHRSRLKSGSLQDCQREEWCNPNGKHHRTKIHRSFVFNVCAHLLAPAPLAGAKLPLG